MNDVVVTVRLPRKLKEDIDQSVKDGRFKNVSDVIVSAARREVELFKISQAILTARKAKKELWERYLKRANGDSKKAAELFSKESKEYEDQNPGFFIY